MHSPSISVIMPTFNNGPEIERAVCSVLQQDWLAANAVEIEIIIINDGSDEGHLTALLQLAAKYASITLLHQPVQAGPGAARNRGIKQAQGDLIGFLDADDEWPPDKLSHLLPLVGDGLAEVAGGKVKYIMTEGLPSPVAHYEDAEQRLTHVHLGALLVKKSVFEKGFYFDESLKFSEDIDWWLRLRENNTPIVITEATTLLYHVHGNNMSVNKSLRELQVLKVLHKSLQRRRNNQGQSIPQVKDFRTQQADPLISIVVPLFNGRDFIDRALNGVLAQTYTNHELLIVDDGSTDEGAEYIMQNYPDARLIKQPNAGVAAARNKGIKESKGDLVAFLDQDDEWLPEKLEQQWALLKQNPYITFVTCNQLFRCDEGTSLPDFFKEELKKEHRSFVPSAVLVRKHALISIGGFDEQLEVGSDVDIIRRLRNAGFAEKNLELTLLHKWYHGTNASMDKKKGVNDMLMILHKQLRGK